MNFEQLAQAFKPWLRTTVNSVTLVEHSEGKMPVRLSGNSDRLIEWLFAFMMIVWGVWLLVPGWTTFNGPAYAMLAAIASETTWGAWSISVGIVRVAALYVNGSYYRTPIVRLACSILGVCWWFVLIYLFVLAAQPNPAAGFSWYPLFAIFEGICCWRSAQDAWISRAFHNSSKVK